MIQSVSVDYGGFGVHSGGGPSEATFKVYGDTKDLVNLYAGLVAKVCDRGEQAYQDKYEGMIL